MVIETARDGLPLVNKAIIVTGGGQGLGLAYAQELARQGASVVINDVDEEVADAAVSSITDGGGRATAVIGPVGPTETAERLVSGAVDVFGRLDGVVTNAGILRDRSLLKMTDEDFDRVIEVHLRGTFTCARAAYRYFKDNGVAGRIVAIGSPTGQRGNFGQTNYAAAKAGIVGMVRTWALEMKKSGVEVNAVIPVAATAMTETVPYFEKAIEADSRGDPMPSFFRHELGFGRSDDVSPLVAFLSSERSKGINGQVLGIGGDRLQLWSHPNAVTTEYRQGGWDFESLGARLTPLEGNFEQVGESTPPLPADLEPGEQP